MNTKIAVINKLNLPCEIQEIIKSFTYHNVNSIQYARYLSKKREPLLKNIQNSVEIDDDGHWYIDIEDEPYLQIEFICCKKCGNYQIIGNGTLESYCKLRGVPIMCMCIDNIYRHYVNDVSDIDSDFDLDDIDLDIDFDIDSDTDFDV